MYSALYEKLPDIQKYLDRIQFKDAVRIDKPTLDGLVYAHQSTVAFENLDIFEYRKDISLAISDLYEKVVIRKRGGYCFELNSIFYSLLDALQFDVYPCLARVVRQEGVFAPALHRGTIVKLDGKTMFCDVGFGGPMPAGAIELVAGVRQQIGKDVFWFDEENPGYWTLSREGSHGVQRVLIIQIAKQDPVDFLALNHYSAHAEQSYFRANRVVNLRTANGSKSLFNDKITITDNGAVTERPITSRRQLYDELENLFGLTLPL